MSGDTSNVAGAGRIVSMLQGEQAAAKTASKRTFAQASAVDESIRDAQETTANPYAARVKRARTLQTRAKENVKKGRVGADDDETAEPSAVKKINQKADEFSEGSGGELNKEILKMLRKFIKPGDRSSDILRKVLDFHKDPFLADQALDFLLETTSGELREEVQKAKEELNNRFDREIRAGKNIGALSRKFSSERSHLGTPTALRDLYRDITAHPREPRGLFDELSKKFNYNDLKSVIFFLMNAAGNDLRMKSSMPHGELSAVLNNLRTQQMILGVYRFFFKRMNLVQKMFKAAHLKVPPQINFESLAKIFMQLAGDRYPSAERILRLSRMLGVQENTNGKIIVFSQFRDAMNEVDGERIFRSLQHRYELIQAILESLEELEDQAEMEEEVTFYENLDQDDIDPKGVK